MREIEKLAGEYREARERLGARIGGLVRHIENARTVHWPEIDAAIRATAKAHARLKAEIATSPGLFKKPKTLVLHGVKCGLQKGKGKIVLKYPEDKTIEMIETLFPGDAYEGLELVEASYSVRKSALAQMGAADLKRLGVTVEDAGDEVVIKVTDSKDEKLVKAFLKEAGVKEAE